MKQHIQQTTQATMMMGMLLLGTLSEVLPEAHHHHHEHGHACVQVDGSYFYFEGGLQHNHGECSDEVSLRAIRLGDSHSHGDCPFCQSTSLFLDSFVSASVWSHAADTFHPLPIDRDLSDRQRNQTARGPPTYSCIS